MKITTALFVHGRKFRTETEDFRNHTLLEEKQIAVLFYGESASRLFRLPVGTKSDLASTPPALWTKLGLEWLPPFGLYAPDCYAHDAAYRGDLEVWDGVNNEWVKAMLPKEDCDDLLLALMRGSGASDLIIGEIYQGVHFGGWKAFNEDRGIKCS